MMSFFVALVLLPLVQFSNKKQKFLPMVHSCLWCCNSDFNCRNKAITAKLLKQGISESEFYGDLVYRIRKIVGKSRKNSKSLFDFCFTALQHILGHFRRGQLT